MSSAWLFATLPFPTWRSLGLCRRRRSFVVWHGGSAGWAGCDLTIPVFPYHMFQSDLYKLHKITQLSFPFYGAGGAAAYLPPHAGTGNERLRLDDRASPAAS